MARKYVIAFCGEAGRLAAQIMTAYPPGTAERMDADRIGGFRWMEVETDKTTAQVMHGCRVVDGALVERPALDLPETLALSVGDEVALTIPVGSVISRDGEEIGICDDGTLEITGDMPDTYSLTVAAWPAVDSIITVTVTEP